MMNKMIKKSLAISILGLSVGIFAFLSYDREVQNIDETKTFVSTYAAPEVKITSRQMASTGTVLSPYKTMYTFTSEERKPNFKFTSVGGAWEKIAPSGTNIEVYVRFLSEEKWSEWMYLEGEPEYKKGNISRYVATASTNLAESMQYKVVMYGDGVSVPMLKNIEWTFLKTGKLISTSSKPVAEYSATTVNQKTVALTENKVGVVTRSSWGANESYRYLKNNDKDPVLVEMENGYYEKYKDELKVSRTVSENADGEKYKWPLQYADKVTKFIIHHTATTKNLDDPSQAIRDIYYYHAMTRGWGDIGYNYVMDPTGKVFEGRAGGEGVIGAHAGAGNTGSIGIAILGNYEENTVPEDVLISLGKFISKKAKINNIDPNGSSSFRGKNRPNVIGHRDIMSTACPGEYLYEKLPLIRSLSSKNYDIKPKYVKDYDFQDNSDVYYVALKPSQEQEITLRLQNIGKKSWSNSTYILVDNDPAFDRVISFPNRDGVILAKMQETYVGSGDTGTFKFKIKGGRKGDTVYMKISVLADGITKTEDGLTLPVSVEQSSYKYDFIDGKYPPIIMSPGEIFEGWIKLKNTGNASWENSGIDAVTLGADHERNRKSDFIDPASSTIGKLKESKVDPGETGTFFYSIKAPKKYGYYQEYFTPLVDGDTWMKDTGMYFEVIVSSGDLRYGEVIEQSQNQVLEPGKSYILWLKLRNMGKETWTKKDASISVIDAWDSTVSNVKLVQDEVVSGAVGEFDFTLTVNKNATIGKREVTLVPKTQNMPILARPMKISFRVDNAPAYGDSVKQGYLDEGNIRIKLSFSGAPEISGSGNFDIYSGEEYLGSAGKNDIAYTYQTDSGYRVKVGKKSYSKKSQIRFIPKDSTILSVRNWDRMGWDGKTKDNTFRGILEIRKEDKKLIVINELPLETYLKGLGEVPNSEQYEKIKAIMVAARSYAKFYMTKDQKFKGKPYNLNDDPAVCQKYLGYNMEKRSPNVTKAVDETKGQMVTYSGELVKTPYFSQSDGKKTKSAMAVWKWNAPYLVSVDDSLCKSTKFAGHGVGMSGCGARAMAERGDDYLKILKHYYTGVEITKMY